MTKKTKKNKPKGERAAEEAADSPEESPPESASEEAAAAEEPETPQDKKGDEKEQKLGESGEDIPLEDQVAALNDKLLRALAEAENVRRRAERDKQDMAKYAVAGFAREMLAVGDNLKRAMESVDADIREKDAAVDQVMVGLEMTEKEMLATFERFGIKPIEAMGEKFDHNLHEAMFEMEDKEKPAGTVVQVIEQGYVLNDRLLRPAKVAVSKGGPKEVNTDNAQKTTKKNALGDAAKKEGRTAYEDQGKEPGAQLDEEL